MGTDSEQDMSGDEFSPGEVINHSKLVQTLMFRVWEKASERKGVALTPESTRYVLAALQAYYMNLVEFRPFASGMHFQIDQWPPSGLAKIVGKVENVTVAHAAFEGAVKAYPGSTITMHHGALIMRNSSLEGGEENLAKAQGAPGVENWRI